MAETEIAQATTLPLVGISTPAYRQFGLYLLAGGSATILNVGVYSLLIAAGIWYMGAHAASESIGFLSAFLLQKYVVFRKRTGGVQHFLRYCSLACVNFFLSSAMLYAGIEWFSLSEEIAKIACIGILVFWNFAFYKFVIYT